MPTNRQADIWNRASLTSSFASSLLHIAGLGTIHSQLLSVDLVPRYHLVPSPCQILFATTQNVNVLLFSFQIIELLHLRRHRPLGDHTNRNDLEGRRDTWCRLKTDSNKYVIGSTKSRTKHQDLRRPGAACQLSTRHGANCWIFRSVSISNVVEVQKLHRLSVVRGGNKPVRIHDQITRCVEGQDDGLGTRRTIETD